ncbi:MAG: O-antigen ligase family protein [Desulfosalsimonadaceae bacterium]
MPEKFSKRLFLFALIFAPLAFGTVEPWSCAVMEIAVFAALFLHFLHARQSGEPFCEVPGLFFLGLFLGLFLLQAVPLPALLVRFVSPASFEIQQNAAFARGGEAWMTLSVHPRATVHAFFRYAAYAAFYILTVQLLCRKEMLKKTVSAVTIFGAALAFSSILQLYLTEDMALWVRHVPVNSMVMGPYVCHNHYAGLMEMILPVVLALFFFYRPRLRNPSLVKGVVEIFGQEKANIHILIGAAALLIGTSIFLSLSRGGIVSTCLAFLVFVMLLSRRRITRSGPILFAFVVILIGLSVSWFGWDMVIERFAELRNEQGGIENARLDYWKDAGAAFRDFPAAGAGFGSFADIYRPYQSLGPNHFVDHAHNDYIELAVEGGIMGLLLAAGFLAVVFFKSYRVFAGRRDRFCIYLYIGSITGVVALLLHSFTDFNLQIGANGLWFFFLPGLAVSAANTRMQLGGDATKLKKRLLTGRARRAALAASGVFLALAVLVNFSFMLGDFYYSHIEDYRVEAGAPDADLERVRQIAGYAAMFDPLSAKYPYKAANAAWLQGEREAAEAGFLRAIARNPVSSRYFKRYGRFLSQGGRQEEAERMLELSSSYFPASPENALEYGSLLLLRGKTEKGLRFLRKAASLDADLLGKVFAVLGVEGFSPVEMGAAVPETPAALVRFAGYLSDIGEPEAAESKYRQALELMEAGGEFKRQHLFRVFRFFERRGKDREAMGVMLLAEKLLPRDARVKIKLGDLYRGQGIYYKAKEKYKDALLIDPDNKGAKRRLNQ